MWSDWDELERAQAEADAEPRPRPKLRLVEPVQPPDTAADAAEPSLAPSEPIVVRPGPSLTPERRRLGLQALRKLLR